MRIVHADTKDESTNFFSFARIKLEKNIVHNIKYLTTLSKPSILFLFCLLLFVGTCAWCKVIGTGTSNLETTTFACTAPLHKTSMTLFRENPECLFVKIPSTVQWKQVISWRNASNISSGQSLEKTSANALLVTHDEGNLGPLGPIRMIKTKTALITERKIKIFHSKKYSRQNSIPPSPVTGGEKVKLVPQDDSKATDDVVNNLNIEFWKFLDVKVHDYAHAFLSFSLPSSLHPTSHQKLNILLPMFTFAATTLILLSFSFSTFHQTRTRTRLNQEKNNQNKYVFRKRSTSFILLLLLLSMIIVAESLSPLPDGNGAFSTDDRIGNTINRIVDDWMDTTKRSGIQTLYGHIEDWDVSSVQNFRYLFVGNSPIAVAFNADLSKWNVAAAQDLSGMFAGAAAFNSDLSTWDTAKVTTMFTMFRGASHFNGDVTKFNTKKVENMQYMFKDALIFNRDLSKWKTDNVVNMGLMFDRALLFNSDLSKWQTSRVASMYKIFQNSGCKLLFSRFHDFSLIFSFSFSLGIFKVML